MNRIEVKYFFEEGAPVDLGAVVSVFHRWIQERALDELLIDVANYGHVVDGPGVLLIAHEADYAIDFTGGRPGLLYRRKRAVPVDLREALSLALNRLWSAARALEEDPGLRFATDEIELVFPDRLRFPNVRESLDLVQAEIAAATSAHFGTEDVDVRWREDDPRLPFGVRAVRRIPAGLRA